MDTLTIYPPRIMFPTFFLVLCVLVFLTEVSLNGYVLFITGCRVKSTVSAVWFQNRAVSDLIFIVLLPLKITAFIILDSDWVKWLSSTITSLHLFSSAFLLTSLSVHRCILVACPTWAQNHCTPRLALWVVTGIWALSLGFGLRYSDLWESLLLPTRYMENFRLYDGRLNAPVAIQFLVGFLIPLAFILIPTFYILLAAKLRRNRLSQSTKPLKILVGLVPTFFICWLPYHIFSFLLISATFHPTLWITEYIFASVLPYFNSFLNPIFYLTMEDEFLSYCQHARNTQIPDISRMELAE